MAVVNALRLENFAPGCAENPKLQRHYAAIQAPGRLRQKASVWSVKCQFVKSWHSM